MVNSIGMILRDWHCIVRSIGNNPEDGGSRLLRKITLSDYTLNIVWITLYNMVITFRCNGWVQINYYLAFYETELRWSYFGGLHSKF